MEIFLVHSRLPPNAGLASDLQGSLLLRSSFSAGVHVLPAPPGREHYANSLGTCSHGSKITEERRLENANPPCHSAAKIYGGFHHLLWGQEGKRKPISRRKSPRGLQLHGGLFQWSTFGSQQVLPAFWRSVKLVAGAQAALTAPVSTAFLPNSVPKREAS